MSDILICMIPIVAIVMVFGTGMLAIFLNYMRRKEMFALYHLERMKAIEKGIELPPLPEDFFRDEPKPSRRSGHGALLAGLILLFFGVILYLALHFTVPRLDNGGDPSLFALIPAGLGAAFLIYYLSIGRKLMLEMEEEQKARLAAAKANSTRFNPQTPI